MIITLFLPACPRSRSCSSRCTRGRLFRQRESKNEILREGERTLSSGRGFRDLGVTYTGVEGVLPSRCSFESMENILLDDGDEDRGGRRAGSVIEEKIHLDDVDRDTESTTVEPQSMAHDSMVTVRLSEPPNLIVNTSILDGQAGVLREVPTGDGIQEEDEPQEQDEDSPRITMMDPNGEVMSPTGSESAASDNGESRRGSESSEASEGGEASESSVNWEALEKTEEQEPRDQGSDDVSFQCSDLSYDDANYSVYGLTSSSTRTRK